MRISPGIVGLASAALLLATGCNARTPTSPSSAPASLAGVASLNAKGPAEHSVIGNGTVTEDGVTFRTNITAHLNAEGTVWGEAVVLLDLRGMGLGKTTFSGRVTCLDVDGHNAWIGVFVTRTTDGTIVPQGTSTISLVRDLGGHGEDIMHAMVFPSSVSCSDRPALPETLVSRGDYKVR